MESRTGHVAGEGSVLVGLCQGWPQMERHMWRGIVWVLAVEQGWMTPLVEEVVLALTEVEAAERKQTRSQCLSWS